MYVRAAERWSEVYSASFVAALKKVTEKTHILEAAAAAEVADAFTVYFQSSF